MLIDQKVTGRGRKALWLACLSAAAGLGGCEANSFLDPSMVGRWQPTPTVMPILETLELIEDKATGPAGLTQVAPEDLMSTPQEQRLGPGDLITVTIFELIAPNVEYVQTRRINELGQVGLPEVGRLDTEGLTPSQLEESISNLLRDKGKLKDPIVSVVVQESRQNTFSVIGEPSVAGTAIGTYAILGRDFRLLDAMALARGVSGSIKKLYIIRNVPLTRTVTGTPTPGMAPGMAPDAAPVKPGPAPEKPADLIQDLLRGIDTPAPGSNAPGNPAPAQPQRGEAAPAPLASGLDSGEQLSPWVNVDGKWVKRAGLPETPAATEADASPMTVQRIIEVPYDRLLDGDTRYNLVIRPGDIIRVPPPVIGNVYVGGMIARPGTYALPGDRDLTLKQLIFAAGNLTGLAMPERVDLVRRVGDTREATIRLNLGGIFAGTEPDVFLKPNDLINVGTNFWATPLAVVRNGYRFTYGFGFVLDRNFSTDVFGPTNE